MTYPCLSALHHPAAYLSARWLPNTRPDDTPRFQGYQKWLPAPKQSNSFRERRHRRRSRRRYNDGMEVQINVAQGDGEPAFDGLKPKPNTYINDDHEEWYNYRLPKNAKGDPIDSSGWEQTFDLRRHYESIGITGWDFKQRRSIGVGFDYDAIEVHKSGTGVEADKLARVTQVAKRLGYVEVRKSTSGTGYHLWVWFDPNNLPETSNHTEHAALARAVLLKMSHDAGFDFTADVDRMGGNMWICTKRATKESGGLPLSTLPSTR